LDETILTAIMTRQNTQTKAILATIIRTEGSTPRDLGTQMLVIDTGQTVGTIGGGTTERLISDRALVNLTSDSDFTAEIHHLAINQETMADKFSACGASIDVLLEPVRNIDFWEFARNQQIKGKDAVMVTSLFPPYTKCILDSQGNVLFGLPPKELVLSNQKLQDIFTRLHSVVLDGEEYSWLVEPVLRTERLLILGAGHVAREVASYALPLNFQITVIDDRAAFALPEFFSGADSVICSDFAQGIKNYEPNSDTYVVIVTRSHQTDAECLENILNYSTKYVGMLGSRKKVSAIVNYLQTKGYTAQNLARLKAPIGVAINAQTPAEIAISILAEIISVRRAG
jgi:xanthine dehydrogenase accessory factor